MMPDFRRRRAARAKAIRQEPRPSHMPLADLVPLSLAIWLGLMVVVACVVRAPSIFMQNTQDIAQMAPYTAF